MVSDTYYDGEDSYQSPPRPPSDDEQEDFYLSEEEEDDYHQMYTNKKEEIKQSTKKIYSKERLLHFRHQTILNIIQSKDGLIPFRFEVKKIQKRDYYKEQDTVYFDSHVDEALDILGLKDSVTLEFNVARKNKTVTVARRNRSENAWVPGALSKHVNTPEKVRSEMIDILNKMTPEKYDNLFKKFFSIEGLQEVENVKVLVRCILDKVLLEKNFSDMYTKLCYDIASYPNFENRNQFKKFLLQETQLEFENGLNLDSKFESTDDPELYEEIEEKKDMAKRKMLGTMRFISELMQKKLLQQSIIIDILKSLFTETGAPDPGNIEALCELFTSLGSHLPKKLLDIVFNQLNLLVENPKYKTRIIFMIQNLIELRKDKWVSRIEEVKAQKLEKMR